MALPPSPRTRGLRGIGVDLGTANTLIHRRGRGILLREPSVVAVDRTTGAVLAAGTAAKRMVGRTPQTITAIHPLRDGVIADPEVAEVMLRLFLRSVKCRPRLFWPTLSVAIPSGLTEVERRAVRDAALRTGARRVLLIEEPLAAAIGAGLQIAEPRGSMLVDIGGGTTEVAVIAMNGIVAGRSLRLAGDVLNQAIVSYLRREMSIEIGISTAERVKFEVGSAYPLNGEDLTTVARGRDLLSGLPREVRVTSQQIREALMEPILGIVEAIKQTLEETPPELSGDIIERGITLTGGGALLRGLDRLLADETGMLITLVDEPLDCVVLGASRALEHASHFADAFVTC
jgi:rod shape-determining protein MreB